MSIKHNIALKIYGSNFLKKILRPLALFILNKAKNKTNTVVYVKKDGTKIYNKKIKNVKIKFSGEASNNYVEIHEPVNLINLAIMIKGNSNTFVLGKGSRIRKMKLSLSNQAKVIIGDNFAVNDLTILTTYSCGRKVEIGSDCLFSYGLVIRTSDAHVIYDLDSGNVLNSSQDVKIGNHVWIGANALILKGSYIPDNCVVGARALVNKKFDKTNCVIAGMPAQIKKENINWNYCQADNWDFKDNEWRFKKIFRKHKFSKTA